MKPTAYETDVVVLRNRVNALRCANDALQAKADTADKLYAGNTVLLTALMDMVNQFFYTHDDEFLTHSFMSAEEHAIEVLIAAGMAEEVEVEGKGYRLLWDKLEARTRAMLESASKKSKQ
jgi:hypothetical protein